MHSQPIVSVVTIFLNEEKFLADAIDSVFAQSYDSWELLLVDDGSTDASTAIAQDWARRYPGRVRYLEHPRHENRGMSASRNRGLDEACGEFVAFLDADDVWLPKKLEEQLAILAAQPRAAMVYGRSEIWHSWTGEPEDRSLDRTVELGVPPDTLIEPPNLLPLLLENKVQTPTTCSALFRRSILERIGGFRDAFRGMFEDQVFFTKLCLSAPVFVSDSLWARYRQHPDSCCAIAKTTGTGRDARLQLLRWLETYLAEQDVKESTVWRALRKELWPYEHPILSEASTRLRLVRRRVRAKSRRLTGAAGLMLPGTDKANSNQESSSIRAEIGFSTDNPKSGS